MLNKKLLEKTDLAMLIILPVIGTILSVVYELNWLSSTLLFFGPLALWLSYRTPKRVAHALIFSIIFSLPMVFIVGYLAVSNRAWLVPESVLPRLFNIVDAESFVWGFLWVYSIIIFYEHFLDKGRHELVNRRIKYLVYIFSSLVLVMLLLIIWSPEVLEFRYPYLKICVAAGLIPLAAFLGVFPNLFVKFFKVTAYFFALLSLNEFVALDQNHWAFPADGQYLGWIHVLGYSFAFEELFFLLITLTTSILCYYEFFDDDRK